MDGPQQHRDGYMEEVDAISAEISIMQRSLTIVTDKIEAIQSGKGLSISKTLDHFQSQWKQQPDYHSKQFDEAVPDFLWQTWRVEKADADSIALPLALRHRWSLDMLKSIKKTTSTIKTSCTLKAKQVKWDNRWEDLFDANEALGGNREDNEKISMGDRAWSGSQTMVRLANYSRKSYTAYYAGDLSACMIHPYSRFRVFWDLLGLILIVNDAITAPVNAAWELPFDRKARALLQFSVAYWSSDVLLTFNTGYFKNSTLKISRRSVCKHYLQTWFFADLFFLALDMIMFLNDGSRGSRLVRNLRIIRVLRFVRGYRLFRMSKVVLSCEYVFNVYGGPAAFVVMTIMKTLGSIFLVTHLTACAWYSIGRRGKDYGRTWMDEVENFDTSEWLDQYTRAFYWVLGHLTAAPTDPTVSPQNLVERIFTISLILCSLLVIGISVSKMSDTVVALNRAHDEANEMKRRLQSYLHHYRFNSELSVRIVKHALEVHKQKEVMTLDAITLSLLSGDIVSEMNAFQRGMYVTQHPLFDLISKCHPAGIFEIYDALEAGIYAEKSFVYKLGSVSDTLHITVGGRYSLRETDSGEMVVTVYEQTEFFCEVSLFRSGVHHSMLQAITFADTLSLHSANFIHCMRVVPSCVGTVMKYARLYLSRVVELPARRVNSDPVFAEVVVKKDEYVIKDVMPKSLAAEACQNAMDSDVPDIDQVTAPIAELDDVHNAIDRILEQELSTDDIINELELAFPEIHPENGLYARMSDAAERKRSVAAMLGLVWFKNNSYSNFVEGQKEGASMTYELWSEWQCFFQWADLNRDIMHSLIVLLAIRGFGKLKAVQKAVPPNWRGPENAVLYLMEYIPNCVPSVAHLSQESFDLVKKMLETHKAFNLAQLMQGENTPYQVLALRECIAAGGEMLLKFYLLTLVGMMCGLTGAVSLKGCLFMDENNARTVFSCIEVLRQLKSLSPHAVYWSYLGTRAKRFGLPTSSPDDLCILRLACLTRASTSTCKQLREAFTKLDSYDRSVLTDHFVADGIFERAFLLSFLPNYLSNAQGNHVVGLHRGLVVLIDLIIVLQSDGLVNRAGSLMTVVNLSDVANFIKEVINSFAFESLAGHLHIDEVNAEIRVSVLPKHWQVASDEAWRPETLNEIAHAVRRMSRITRSILGEHADEHNIEQLHEEHLTLPTVPKSPRVLKPRISR